MNISKELAKLLNSNENKGTKPYDTKATVKRVENGIAWVHIPGGVDETPAQLTINAKPGDSVQVRVADGKAFLVGNGSSPPTDDTTARQAIDFSKIASDAANAAVRDASTARTAAASAQASADHAEEVAGGVEAIAESAKTAADTAFINLSQVQSVLEVAQWIATHGTYVKATVFNPNATYYTITATQVATPSDDDKDSQGVLIYYELDNGIYVKTTDTSVDDQKTYYRVTGTPVAQPSAEHIADYYTLAVSEAMADYVQSHLALTDDGLYVMKDDSKWKVRIKDNGVDIIDGTGATDVVVAQYGASVIIGETDKPNKAHLLLQRTELSLNARGEKPIFFTAGQAIYESLRTGVSSRVPSMGSTRATEFMTDIIECNFIITFYFVVDGSVVSIDLPYIEGAKAEAYNIELEMTSCWRGRGFIADIKNNNSFDIYTGKIAGSTDTILYGFQRHFEDDSIFGSVGSFTDISDRSFSVGEDNNVNTPYSLYAGYNLTGGSQAQVVTGRYNKKDYKALVIGNGTDENNRSNAFTVGWDGKVECGNYQGKLTALLDLTHPKGSTYGTVLPPTINGHSYDDGNLTDADIDACGDTWFDPRIMWGGTWEKLPEGYILLSGSEYGNYIVGDDTGTTSGYKEYGANTKNITVSNMPSHDHAVNESDSKYFLTVDKSPDNAVGRRTIKNGTGSNLQYNLYSENAITRTSTTGSRGSGSAFNVMQKSIAVYTWIRTA